MVVDGAGPRSAGAGESAEGGAWSAGSATVGPYRLVNEVATGLEPEGVAVDTRRRRAFVACARGDAVSVVDLVGGVVVAEVPVGREPMDIVFDEATGRIFA